MRFPTLPANRTEEMCVTPPTTGRRPSCGRAGGRRPRGRLPMRSDPTRGKYSRPSSGAGSRSWTMSGRHRSCEQWITPAIERLRDAIPFVSEGHIEYGRLQRHDVPVLAAVGGSAHFHSGSTLWCNTAFKQESHPWEASRNENAGGPACCQVSAEFFQVLPASTVCART